MENTGLLKERLNDYLYKKLEAAHCAKGVLEVENTPGTVLLVLRGEKEDGKAVFFWNPDPALKALVGRYLRASGDVAGFSLRVGLDGKASFVYEEYTAAVMGNRKKKAEQEKLREGAAQKNALKSNLQSLSSEYGIDLAEKVAEVLARQSLGYGHRDYCGTGLERSADGGYVYGALWDGALEPIRQFTNKTDFVEWLSRQSDASLARLEEKDPFFWGNQVIDRKRLEAFVAGV